jgi:hypothetical protein
MHISAPQVPTSAHCLRLSASSRVGLLTFADDLTLPPLALLRPIVPSPPPAPASPSAPDRPGLLLLAGLGFFRARDRSSDLMVYGFQSPAGGGTLRGIREGLALAAPLRPPGLDPKLTSAGAPACSSDGMEEHQHPAL